MVKFKDMMNEYILKEVARRIIDSPRSKEQMLAMLKQTPSISWSYGNDTIGRQAALDALGDEPMVWNDTPEEIAERNQWKRDVEAIKAVPSTQSERWDTCFSCPLSHGCPVIRGCTNDQAERYASEIPTNCPLDKEYERIFKEHGRLGDLDALEKEMAGGIKAGLLIDGYENYPNINNVDDCLELVKYADTIIEANHPVFIRTKSKSRIEPSVQSDQEDFEWCTNCKEYDQEQHCCHRFTKVIRNTVEELKTTQFERKMSNKEWIDFLVCQFDISRTSAKEMLHGMMQWKKEDNFKKQFSGRSLNHG